MSNQGGHLASEPVQNHKDLPLVWLWMWKKKCRKTATPAISHLACIMESKLANVSCIYEINYFFSSSFFLLIFNKIWDFCNNLSIICTFCFVTEEIRSIMTVSDRGSYSKPLCYRVPLTPRQALFSHPRPCYVFLYDRTDWGLLINN